MSLPMVPRVVRRWIGGDVYHPVELASGRYADLLALEQLRDTPGARPDITRMIRLVLFDETPVVWHDQDPGGAGDATFNCAAVDEAACRGVSLPLVFGAEPTLSIGLVREIVPQPAGAIPGTTGTALVARARLLDSRLADIAWRAIDEGLMTNICAELDAEYPADGRITAAFRRVRLIAADGAHMPGARVLEAWSAPALAGDRA